MIMAACLVYLRKQLSLLNFFVCIHVQPSSNGMTLIVIASAAAGACVLLIIGECWEMIALVLIAQTLASFVARASCVIILIINPGNRSRHSHLMGCEPVHQTKYALYRLHATLGQDHCR